MPQAPYNPVGGLTANESIFQKNIEQILEDGLRSALKATYMDLDDSSDNGSDMADQFAKVGAKKISGPLAKCIKDYVLSMSVMLTPTTLSTPLGGMVAGMSDTMTGQIQLK